MASTEGTEQFETATEVSNLKDKYGDKCKIITNIGDFTHVVTFRKYNSKLCLKFQLEESYPSACPGIVVRNEGLDNAQIKDLCDILNKKAKSLIRQSMLHELIELATEWCESRECQAIECDRQSTKYTKKSGNKQKKKQTVLKEEKSYKLPSMKTAEDVVSRIIWDRNLPREQFTIGYLDRFLGVVEKSFMEFSWEDLASVDYDTLAIPKHRIQYFKYKDVIVWDKNKRLDNFFGSTGSEIKIQDVIENYDSEKLKQTSQEAYTDASDESDDEDVVITVGNEDSNGENEYNRDNYWGPKKRPTYFLCLRVTSPEIVAAINEVQRQILSYDPSYEDSLIPSDKLHMTLACLGLDTYFDIQKASDWLHDIHSHLESFRPRDIEVRFRGVGHFFHNVLYAKVEPNEEMMKFVHTLRECVRKDSIEIRDVFDFTPHMTILKFKKHHQAMAHTRYIDPKLYDMFSSVDFGCQSFDNVHLCKMATEMAADGFYICPRKIKLSNRLS